MKKILALLVVTVLLLTALTACGSKSSSITIAVPNDATNEARALLLLQDNGYIKLKDGAGITATINDIAENPKNITFNEVEAAQVPNVLKDVDYAIINSNYAIPAGLNPTTDSLLIEGSASAYGNVLVVKEGNEETDKIKALKAAVASQQVADYITETYGGAVVSVVENPGNGYDDSVDYDALADMDDEACIAALTRLRGVGRWTAEMLLIFSLQRQNVMSFGDYGPVSYTHLRAHET